MWSTEQWERELTWDGSDGRRCWLCLPFATSVFLWEGNEWGNFEYDQRVTSRSIGPFDTEPGAIATGCYVQVLPLVCRGIRSLSLPVLYSRLELSVNDNAKTNSEIVLRVIEFLCGNC